MTGVLSPGFWILVMAIAGIYAIFALGLQIQYGVAGLMNFGHVSSMALSSYTTAILVMTYEWSLWWAAFVGVCVAALGGALLSLTTLKLRGDYFAVVTIAFSEIVRYVIFNSDELTGGSQGSLNIPNERGVLTFTDSMEPFVLRVTDFFTPLIGEYANRDFALLIFSWSLAILLFIIMARLQRTSWARVLKATREDDNVAAALGKNVFLFRLQAVVIGSVIGGIAGIMWAFQFAILAPDDFTSIITFYAWMIIIMGGATRVIGVSIGAIFFGLLYAGTRFFEFWPFSLLESPERAYVRIMIIGGVLMFLMLKRPQGIFGKRTEMVLE